MITNHLPAERLTNGPDYHWFGYYDKLAFDPTGRYLLAMEVSFEGRMPAPDDHVKLGMLDLAERNRWIDLATTSAWCWQQGCMLQWLPGRENQIIWNDREEDAYVSRILDVGTGGVRTIPHPIYSVSPDGTTAVTADFRRIDEMRPGYGYAGLPDPRTHQSVPEDSGIWRVDLQTGSAELIMSIAQIAATTEEHAEAEGVKHYFNHLLFSPDGQRFVFLNRCGAGGGKRWDTRMFSSRPDGSDIRLVTDGRGQPVSHFIWRDPDSINVWVACMRGFYVFADDGSGQGQLVLEAPDGHQSYLPGNEWMLYDCYPQDEGVRRLLLCRLTDRQIFEIGRFPSPPEYSGPLRCDLHPRFSPDGRKVVIDSAHDQGRQLYMLDISEILDA